MGNITGNIDKPGVKCLVYDAATLSWVSMTQPLVKTDNLTVTGTITNEVTVKQGTPGTSAWGMSLEQLQVTGTLGALDAVVNANVDSAEGTAVFQVSGTWSGKIVIEGAVDGTYNNLSIVQPGGTISFSGINNDNQNGVYRILLIAGYTKLRLRMSSYTSGTASVVINVAPLTPTSYAWQLNAANLQTTATQGAAGATSWLVTDDPFAKYKCSDMEEAATSYYGFIDAGGNWFIMQVTSTAIRFIKGTSGYTTNWTNRAGLSYGYYDVIF